MDHSGYVLVSAPLGHPYARYHEGRKYGRILEHRLVMEEKLGRLLKPSEVVDHIDGNTLNNHPDNLRLFASNAEHLRATLSGQTPAWSSVAKEKLLSLKRDKKGRLQPSSSPKIDTYHLRKATGDVRRKQILRAHEQLGKEAPCLLGMERFLGKGPPDSRPKKRTGSEK